MEPGYRFSESMNEVLALSEWDVFMGRNENPLDLIIQRINEAIERAFIRLIEWFLETFNFRASVTEYNVELIRFIFIFVFVASAIGAILWLTLRIAKKRAPKLSGSLIQEIAQGAFSVESSLAAALRYKKDGDFRNALRQLYIAALVVMRERGILIGLRAYTNKELLKSLKKSNSALETDFGELCEVYESSWFGVRQPKEDAWENGVLRARFICGFSDLILSELKI